ncbi:MAG: hypothetical protein U0572_14950 [Phycisphaerales bacterium]
MISPGRRIWLAATLCFSVVLMSCASAQRARAAAPPTSRGPSELEVQALVMLMADEYMSALSEVAQTIVADPTSTPTGRRVAQAFHKNGMASALDIGVGANPDVAVLDMLVLASLQRWAFSEHWSRMGMPTPLIVAAEVRLRSTEESLWSLASRVLTDEQASTLRSLIDDWIKSNPDRRLVSYVRFSDFVDSRTQRTPGDRARAEGLFREVSEATAAVDEIRLLGERSLWFAARYPSLVGTQVETTLYRSLDQPEVRSLLGAVSSLSAIADGAATFKKDFDEERQRFFESFRTERVAAIDQARASVESVTREALRDLETRVSTLSESTVTRIFDRIAMERHQLLEDLESRERGLQQIVNDVRSAIGESTDLASELTGTAEALDHILARFDREAVGDRRPLDLKNLRDAAIETRAAAKELATLLDRTNAVLESGVWDERIAQVDQATSGVVDRAFWRGLALVGVLLVGLALVRLVPQRVRAAPPRAE